jgi:hypothetical protein
MTLKDPYADPQRDVELRKHRYLAMVAAQNDIDGVANRRSFLRRSTGNNPRPKNLSEGGTDSDWLTNNERRTRHFSDRLFYLAGEDVSVVLARLCAKVPFSKTAGDELPAMESFPPRLFPPEAGNQRLPGLNDVVLLPVLLGTVQLLGVDFQTFLKDQVFKPGLGEKLWFPVWRSLYTWADRQESPRFQAEARQWMALAVTPKSAPDRIDTATADAFASRIINLGEVTGSEVLNQLASNLDVAGAKRLSAEQVRALEWLVFLEEVRREPLGQALRALALRWRNECDEVKRAWLDKRTNDFDVIPKCPFIWPLLWERPNLRLPEDFPWPPFNDEGVYWWVSIIWRHCLKHVASRIDTADFHVTDLLRFCLKLDIFRRPAGLTHVPEYAREAIKWSFLQFKYWFDEPPSVALDAEAKGKPGDALPVEMTFWSENHQIQFGQAGLLVGSLFPDETFYHASSGGRVTTGREQVNRAIPRLHRWLDQRLKFGFSEWNAPGYYNEDFPPLFNLVDFSPDPVIKNKAAMVLDLLMFDVARFTCAGSFGAAAGRAYLEHKDYGWNQSVGDLIEIAFGARGDFVGAQNCGVALATSSYEIPQAILAIGLDRIYKDRQPGALPFKDRSRVSVTFEEAQQHGLGPETEHGITFWWGNAAYLVDETREHSLRFAEAHPNLPTTGPFVPLTLSVGGGVAGFVTNVIKCIAKTPGLANTAEFAAGAALSKYGTLLPFPLNAFALVGTVQSISSIAKALGFVKNLAKKIASILLSWTGLTSDEEEWPEIPQSDLIEFYHRLIHTFNRGSVLERANLVCFHNGHAMLSSVQNHGRGLIGAQKQPWMASLGCDACVWTTAPWPEEKKLGQVLSKPIEALSQVLGNTPEAFVGFMKAIGQLRPIDMMMSIASPFIPNPMGHDGPNEWTGSFSLPMVVQHEHVALIVYDLPLQQREMADNVTHAWFPADYFDEVRGPETTANEGAWVFGRKSEGFVALYSAQGMKWTDDSSKHALRADGGRNVWICVIGRAVGSFSAGADFEHFCNWVRQAQLEISGLTGFASLRAMFQIPQAGREPNMWCRLEVDYAEGVARLDGTALSLDDFPRFENCYVTTSAEPPLSGANGRVPWGAPRYYIHHPHTQTWVFHDHNAVRRKVSEMQRKVPAFKHPFRDDGMKRRLPRPFNQKSIRGDS